MWYREFCLVCWQRITDVSWDPVCCEVCWDSLAAEEQRWCDANQHWVFAPDGQVGIRSPSSGHNQT